MNLFPIFAETVKKHGLLKKNERVLVGLSGGADSVALLHLLLQTLLLLQALSLHWCLWRPWKLIRRRYWLEENDLFRYQVVFLFSCVQVLHSAFFAKSNIWLWSYRRMKYIFLNVFWYLKALPVHGYPPIVQALAPCLPAGRCAVTELVSHALSIGVSPIGRMPPSWHILLTGTVIV